jgi:hypothetical protein
VRGYYPIDWPRISQRVRFERAAGICQGCGRPHGETVRWLLDGRWFHTTRHTWHNGRPAVPVTRSRTSRRLGNPAAEQAEGPPTNPVEMGLPDIACAVYRASQRPYRTMFESVWGQQAFAIAWPSDVEQVCARPGPPPAGEPMPVHLTSIDRGRASTTFDQMAQSIAGYEASAEVTRTILRAISRRGNRYLRALFVQAAWVVLVKMKDGDRYGLKASLDAAKKGLHHIVLAIALANKLARIAWAVLNKERVFEFVKTRAMASQPA